MTTKKAPAGDYDVGYGKTPEHTRFPNQRRRKPRKAKAPARYVGLRQITAELFRALEAPVTVVDKKGKRAKKTASQTIFDQLVAKAVKGDNASIRRVVDLQIALARDYEQAQLRLAEEFASFEAYMRNKGARASPEAQVILKEMRRRLYDPRAIFNEDDEEDK